MKREAELRTILTAAAEAEGRRQVAKERGDMQAQYQAERELAALWRRWGQLERQVDVGDHRRAAVRVRGRA
jgi:hypothetical protein